MTDLPLLEYALGDLPPEESDRIGAELARSPERMAELQILRDGLDAVAVTLPSIPAPAGGRARLMAALSDHRRFLRFVDELARLFDLTADAMAQVLSAIDRIGEWTEVGVPGVRAYHFQAGPRLAGADTGLVHFARGARFPFHRHHGRELTFVLEGTFHFSTGEVLGPGDSIVLDGGHHEVWAAEDGDVFYVTFHHGLTVEP